VYSNISLFKKNTILNLYHDGSSTRVIVRFNKTFKMIGSFILIEFCIFPSKSSLGKFILETKTKFLPNQLEESAIIQSKSWY
jgi:hypothetical protein